MKISVMPVSIMIKNIQDGKIKKPEWQREYVWTSKHRANFISAVFRGTYINLLHIYTGNDRSVSFILDGLQRVTTLSMLVSDKLIIDLKCDDKMDSTVVIDGKKYNLGDCIHKKKFSMWDERLQQHILNYELSYDVMYGLDEDMAKEMFESLNRNKQLNTQEIRNIKIDVGLSAFVDYIQKQCNFINYMKGTKSMIKNQKHKEIIFTLVSLVMNGRGSSIYSKDIDLLIKTLALDFPEHIKERIEDVLRFLIESFEILLSKNIEGSHMLLTKSGNINILSKGVLFSLFDLVNSDILDTGMTPQAFAEYIVQFWLSHEQEKLQIVLKEGINSTRSLERRYSILREYLFTTYMLQ